MFPEGVEKEKLARELQADGHPISPSTVAALLPDQGYRLQSDATCHALHIERYPFHGEWNDIIKPDSQT